MIGVKGEILEAAKRIQKFVSPHIPEDVEIKGIKYRDETGGSGKLLNCETNSKLSKELFKSFSWNTRETLGADNAEVFNEAEDKILGSCPVFRGVQLSFYKTGEPQVHILEAEDYVKQVEKEIQLYMDDWGDEALEVNVSFLEEDVFAKAEFVLKAIKDGEEISKDHSVAREDVMSLWDCLNRPKVIKIEKSKDKFTIKTEVPWPELGIESISGEESKAIAEDDSRLLGFILGNSVGEDYISYSYLDNNDTRRFVDFTGELVKNYLDIDEYINVAKTLKNEEALLAHFEANQQKVREGIETRIKESDGEYKKTYKKLMGMSLKKVLFEKTQFTKANESVVLREYMFFLSMISKGNYLMDIHQSDTPELTEIFWMTSQVPETNWSDVEPKFPPYPFAFQRN